MTLGIGILCFQSGGQGLDHVDLMLLAVQIQLEGITRQQQRQHKQDRQPGAGIQFQQEGQKIADGRGQHDAGSQTGKHLEDGGVELDVLAQHKVEQDDHHIGDHGHHDEQDGGKKHIGQRDVARPAAHRVIGQAAHRIGDAVVAQIEQRLGRRGIEDMLPALAVGGGDDHKGRGDQFDQHRGLRP